MACESFTSYRDTLAIPFFSILVLENIIVGARFPNHQVISQSDARPCQLQEQLVSSSIIEAIQKTLPPDPVLSAADLHAYGESTPPPNLSSSSVENTPPKRGCEKPYA
jgi:hypothetical protein